MKRINKNIEKIIDFLATNNLNSKNIKKIFSWDSQSIRRGQVFISIKTKLSKKYNYINEAIIKGARAVISDVQINKSLLKNDLPILYSKYLSDNHNEFLNFVYKDSLLCCFFTFVQFFL